MDSGARRHRPVAIAVAIASSALVMALLAGPAVAKWKGSEPGLPWPPPGGEGTLFVHYGEEHITDEDGPTLLPKAVKQVVKFGPALVTMSGDKADDGVVEQFELWSEVMHDYEEAGIPYFAAIGNHDRTSQDGQGGFPENAPFFETYMDFFADRPYPWGDATPYGDPIRPGTRPAGDPEGASTHYFVDVGADVRWIFIDNSCWSIIECDPFQNPSAQNEGGGEAQFDFLARVAAEAEAEGRSSFVVMHMPTQDVADQSYREPTAVSHTMGKGALGLADNTTFETVAAENGVDGVFLGHIKGQFLYEGMGGVPYFIDGGAGGELYTTGPIGTDHGYWHGFRIFRADGSGILDNDVVPTFVKDGITIVGPRKIPKSEPTLFEAFGRQPVFHDPAKVEMLELRDPDPLAPGAGRAAGAGLAPLKWLGPPLLVLLGLGAASALARTGRRRVAVPLLVAAGGGLGLGGLAIAQQTERTSTAKENLPIPARIWTSEDPKVLAPVAAAEDDERRNPRTQTAHGRFRGVCPGITKLRIASGFVQETVKVEVAGERTRAVKRLVLARTVRAGQRKRIVRARLSERARVAVRVLDSGGRKVADLGKPCHRTRNGPFEAIWDGTGEDGRLDPGRYSLRVTVNAGVGDRTVERRPLLIR